MKPGPTLAHEATESVTTHLATSAIVGCAFVQIVFTSCSCEATRALAHLRRRVRTSATVETHAVRALRIIAAGFTVKLRPTGTAFQLGGALRFICCLISCIINSSSFVANTPLSIARTALFPNFY